MKNEPIPPEHHLSRYCGGATILSGGRISGAAFHLKTEKNEEYLSVNWLEFLNGADREASIQAVRKALGTKMSLGSTAALAVLNVGEIQSHVRASTSDKRAIRILHRPDEPAEKPDPSHSGIFDTLVDEVIIAELIVQKVLETHRAKLGR